MRYFRGIYYLFLNFIGYIPCQTLRLQLYKLMGLKTGRNTTLYGNIEFKYPKKITIGDRSIIGNHCMLDGRKGLIIGKDVNISHGAWIWTLHHDVNSNNFDICGAPVIIEDNVWVCARAMILPGVKVGEFAVVAAGAVVTNDVPNFSIVAGIPAKVIGKRGVNNNYHLKKGLPFI